jgi:hypothetical protein
MGLGRYGGDSATSRGFCNRRELGQRDLSPQPGQQCATAEMDAAAEAEMSVGTAGKMFIGSRNQ